MKPSELINDEQLADVEARLKETKAKLEKLVREYPLTSVAVALGLGYVLARIIEKSRRT